jgi:hypothetical protein
MTNKQETHLRKSALVMRLVGWVLVPFLLLGFILYAPGFSWGTLPEGLSIGPAHPPSHYDGLHPYVFMLVALYVAWAILLIRGARDPLANAALFDWGILANLLHGLVMIPQAFFYPNEHAHLWTDIPVTFVLCTVMWIWHPNRVRGMSKDVPMTT